MQVETLAQSRLELYGVAEAREVVALGFVIGETDADASSGEGIPIVAWFELPNVAGVGEFMVEGQDLKAVFESALVDPAVSAAQALLSSTHPGSVLSRVLWHSHYISDVPSNADIADFPEWLVDVGMIYHVPTSRTVLYNASGIISPVSPDQNGALPTAEGSTSG